MIDYTFINDDEFAEFKKTCKFTDISAIYQNQIRFGSLVCVGWVGDCTTIIIHGISEYVVYGDIDPRLDLIINEIKRMMWYGGKNTAMVTLPLTSRIAEAVIASMNKYGFDLVSSVPSSRNGDKNKYTFIYEGPVEKIGYHYIQRTNFKIDPFFKE